MTTFKVLPSVNRFASCHYGIQTSSNTGKAGYKSKQNTVNNSQIHNSLKATSLQTKLKQSNCIHFFCEACDGVKPLHRSKKEANKCANEHFVSCWFSFTLDDVTVNRFVSEIHFQNPFKAGNQLNADTLSQSASSDHTFLITKSALVIKKKITSFSAKQGPVILPRTW